MYIHRLHLDFKRDRARREVNLENRIKDGKEVGGGRLCRGSITADIKRDWGEGGGLTRKENLIYTRHTLGIDTN